MLLSVWGNRCGTNKIAVECRACNSSFFQLCKQSLVDAAQTYLNNDPACTAAMGTNIELGPIYGQSMSSSHVNGLEQSRTNLQVGVSGSIGNGMVHIQAVNSKIERMVLQMAESPDIEVWLGDTPRDDKTKTGETTDPPVIDAEIL